MDWGPLSGCASKLLKKKEKTIVHCQMIAMIQNESNSIYSIFFFFFSLVIIVILFSFSIFC